MALFANPYSMARSGNYLRRGMPRYVSPYQPMTSIGQTFNNLATAMFGSGQGPNTAEAQEAAAARDTAHANYFQAEAGKTLQQQEAIQQENIRRRTAPRRLLQAETGLTDPQADVLDQYFRQGQWGEPETVSPSPPDELGGGPPQLRPAQQPAWFTPEVQAGGRRARRTQAVVDMGNKSNADQIAKAMQDLSLLDTVQNSLQGKQDPTEAAAAFFPMTGHAPFTGQREGATNVLSGGQTINPLGEADIEDKISQSFLRDEQARTEGPRRELLGAQTSHAQAEAGLAGARKAEIEAGKKKPVAVTPDIVRHASPTVLGAFGIQYDKTGKLLPGSQPELDPQTESAIMQRWSEIYQNTQNSGQATQQVVDEFSPNLRATDTGVADPNTGFLGIGRKNIQNRKLAPGAGPAVPQPRANVAPGGTARPGGKNDQQLIDEANDAIQRGAPRDEVMRRLKNMGVTVN